MGAWKIQNQTSKKIKNIDVTFVVVISIFDKCILCLLDTKSLVSRAWYSVIVQYHKLGTKVLAIGHFVSSVAYQLHCTKYLVRYTEFGTMDLVPSTWYQVLASRFVSKLISIYFGSHQNP